MHHGRVCGRYGPLVALYDTYVEAEREKFLQGMSTDLLAMLAEHVRDRRQRAGYETFYTLVERVLCMPDMDRFRRDYVNAKSQEVSGQEPPGQGGDKLRKDKLGGCIWARVGSAGTIRVLAGGTLGVVWVLRGKGL